VPRNPSEIMRLYDELEYWQSKVANLSSPKSSREEALAQVRNIERILGIERKPYNQG